MDNFHPIMVFFKTITTRLILILQTTICIVAVSFIMVEETGVHGENHCPAASHWQTLSHDVVSSTPRLSGIRTHNASGDKYWLHM